MFDSLSCEDIVANKKSKMKIRSIWKFHNYVFHSLSILVIWMKIIYLLI